MPRLIGTLVRWSLVPFLLLLAAAMAGGLSRALYGGLGTADWAWLAGGFAFRMAARLAWARLGRDDPFEFIDTLEHELTHALAGYATFCPPVSLSASLKSGGEVELKGTNPLAALAPYCLPLWCLLAALLGLAVKAGLHSAWNHGLLFLLGCFAWRLFREFRWRQTDLHLYGFVFSSVMVAVLLMLSIGLLLWLGGYLGWEWLPLAAREAYQGLGAWYELLFKNIHR